MARTSNLSKLSVSDIQAELRRRKRTIGTLQRKRERLIQKIAALDAKIADAGGRVTGNGRSTPAIGTRRRAVNETPLPDALHKVMKGKTMGIAEAAEAVQKAGFKTFSKNFRIQVTMMLSKHGKLFKRVGRGQYTTK